jgi:hypothetical protein
VPNRLCSCPAHRIELDLVGRDPCIPRNRRKCKVSLPGVKVLQALWFCFQAAMVLVVFTSGIYGCTDRSRASAENVMDAQKTV